MRPADIPACRLYSDLAFLMPLISPPEDYAEEAAHWRGVLREKLGPGRHSILELGVGAGHNLSHLAADFDATALDLSDAMLALCRRLNPTVALHQGDMRTARLGRAFDAVLIHDAIAHMLTEDDLAAVFETAASHLKAGGVFVTAPEWYAETFAPPVAEHATRAGGGGQVTYFEYLHRPDPAAPVIEAVMTYVIDTPEGLRIEHDRHPMGLFPRATWLRLMDEAGFEAEARAFTLTSLERPYELLVGVRRG